MTRLRTERRRRSIRLPDYNYSQAGCYFVTVCIHNRECMLGEIQDDRMVLSEAGRAVQAVWNGLEQRFRSVALDAFVVMPNHVHGIVIIVDRGGRRSLRDRESPAPTGSVRPSVPACVTALGDVVGAFKSLAAVTVNRLLARSGCPLWQRNYYEHIIRDDDELRRVREYIADNPAKWAEDHENPRFRMRGRRSP